jgi:hypothetical protein
MNNKKWVLAHKYRLLVICDEGVKLITTIARNKKNAVDLICRNEPCPESAILCVERIIQK